MSSISNIDQVLAQMRALASQASATSVGNSTPPAGRVDFSQMLGNAIGSVNDTQLQSDQLKQSFELGDRDVNLSEVMVAVQKSDISFQAMVQVRNKLIDAYKEVMNMPI